MDPGDLFRPEILGLLIPIIAILTIGAVKIVGKVIVHRKRMAMIEEGLHPDYPPDDYNPPAKQAHYQPQQRAGK